jgi:PAS domain S-box-containing protein
MLWLGLLAIVTVLVIVLRRVLMRQIPLRDEIYSKRVAIEHVNTGVAWIGADGKLRTVNPALTRSLSEDQKDLIGREWSELFVPSDREMVRQAYSDMLLRGRASAKVRGMRHNGSFAWLDVTLIAVHDHKMRFVGLHCLAEDRTREHELEERIDQLTRASSTTSA